jgi:regulatory protein
VRSELVRVKAVDRAARALGRRALSAQELSERLERAGISPASRRETVERLAESGAIDDSRFARERADLLARRGAGDALIRHNLAERGVSAEVTQEAIASLEPEAARAEALAATRGPSVKTARYLARKGFSEEAIEAAVGEAVAESAPPAVP